MTLRHVDSMALYNSDAEATASGKWTVIATGSATYRQAGRNTGAYCLFINSYPGYFGRDLSLDGWTGSNVGVIVGCAINPYSAASGNQVLCLRGSGTSTTSGVLLNYSVASGWYLQLGNTGTSSWSSTVATSAATVGTWDYHEIKILPGGTSGSASRVIWKKNGTQVYDSGAGAVDIKTSTISYLTLGNWNPSGSQSADSYYTDLYVCNTTGSNADFLGDTRIECLLPTGDGHRQDLTPTVVNLLSNDMFGLEGSLPYSADSTTSPYNNGGTVTRSTDFAYSGSYSLKTLATGGNQPPAATTGARAIPVQGSTQYTLAWRWYNSVSAVSVKIHINQQDANGASLGASDPDYQPTYSTVGSWQTDSMTFTTTSSCKTLQIWFWVNTSTSGRVIYWDEIGLYAGATAYYQPPGAWGNVSELPKNDDTSWVHGGTDGTIQTFQMSDLNSVSGNVVGVVVNPWARAENTGTRQLQPVFGGPGSASETSFLNAAAMDEGWDAGGFNAHFTPGFTVREGDELFCVIVDGYGTMWPGHVTDSASWTALYTNLHLHPYGDVYVTLLHRTAMSTDVNRIWDMDDGGFSLQTEFFFAYRGCKYISSNVNYSLTNSQATPSVTPSKASTVVNLYVLSCQSLGLGGGTITGPSSPVTSRFTANTNNYTAAFLGDESVAAGAGGGNRTATTGVSATNAAFYAFNIVLEGVASSVGSTASSGSLNNDLAYHLVPLIVESNPITTAAWTISDVNAIEAGVKLN